jgi:hypothetical protein
LDNLSIYYNNLHKTLFKNSFVRISYFWAKDMKSFSKMSWKHIWHMDKCVNKWNMNIWMNKCHTNFAYFYKSMCQMCFQCIISMHEMYKLWTNEFCTIFIINLWDVKFVVCLCRFIWHLFLKHLNHQGFILKSKSTW